MPRRTTTAATLALSGLGLLALSLPAPAADAATSDPAIRVPTHGALNVAGRGYGHGHGMSQYGAEGAARKGLSGQQIVRFYYPHTTGGHVGGQVKVLISADTDQSTTIVARPGLAVRDLGDGSTTKVPTSGKPAKATRWRMSSGGGGATEVSYLTGSWHVWRTLSGDGEFRTTGKALTLVLAGDRVTYRGTLRSLAPVSPTTHRITVNKVSLEGYVQGVVPREMPALWHQAALRAQAIAARTYAAFEARSSANPRFNLCDTSACQVYGGKSAEYPTSNTAVARTAKQVRMHHGRPAFTQFSSSNGGWTAAGNQSYLVAEKDPYDGWSGNPNHTWSVQIKVAAVENAYPTIGNLQKIVVTKRDGNGQWNGRVLDLKLVGGQGTAHTTGDDFRSRLGLLSTWFDLST